MKRFFQFKQAPQEQTLNTNQETAVEEKKYTEHGFFLKQKEETGIPVWANIISRAAPL